MDVLFCNLSLGQSCIIFGKFLTALVLTKAIPLVGCCQSTSIPLLKKMQDLIANASYIVVTCDESTRVDNTSLFFLYVYGMENWARTPLLLILQKLDAKCYTVDALLMMITSILAYYGQMEDK